MSDKKISDLVELTSLAADDVLPVVDASANATKRITGANLTTAVRGDTGTLTLGDGTAISSLGADSFRLTANATSSGTLTAWERVDEPTSAKVGTGVSQASGTFNVPNSGVWLISYTASLSVPSPENFVGSRLFINANEAARVFLTHDDRNGASGFSSTELLVSLTPSDDITVDRLTFGGFGQLVLGNTDANRTVITFLRVGDA